MYLKDGKISAAYGGTFVAQDRELPNDDHPHALMGTIGRLLGLAARAEDLELEDLSRVLVVGLVFVVQLFLRLKLYTGDNFKPPSTDVAVRAEKLWQADLTKYNL